MEKIKIYVAVLNEGPMRSELYYGIVRMLFVNPYSNLKFIIEDPQLTRGRPISSNRNKIKGRFLATDCNFLMMFDSDNVPFGDPAELVLFDKDIVACPYKTRNSRGELVWTAYERFGDGYVAIDLDSLENPPDLLSVDAVAAGCIVIKRCVLESMKIPFEDTFNEYGVWKSGEDMSFCAKAKAAGFDVFTTPKMRCEHFKCDGLYSLEKAIKEG